MNLLFITREVAAPSSGGIERVNWVLTKYFESEGINVSFLCYHSQLLNGPNMEGSPKYFFFPNPKDFNCTSNIRFLSNLVEEQAIHVIINQGNFDIGFVKLLQNARSESIFKLISVMHGAFYNYPVFKSVYKFKLSIGKKSNKRRIVKLFLAITALREYLLYKRAIKIAIQSSDVFVVLSVKTQQKINLKWPELTNTQYKVIPNPLSFENPRIEAIKKNKVLFVGRLEHNSKRIDRLIRIWSQVENEFPEWTLHIVGGPHPNYPDNYQIDERNKLMKLAKELELRNIVFEGHQDPQPLYYESQVFCLTSSHEGFGLAITEAMQHGLVPIVFNSFDSCESIIDNEINGIIVEAFDLDSYADSLKRVLNDDEYRRSLAQEAIKKSKVFGLDRVGKQWMCILNQFGVN